MYDNTHAASASINFQTACRFNFATPSVLEVDQGHPISVCSQVPTKGSSGYLNLYMGPQGNPTSTYIDAGFNLAKWFPIGSNPPDCFWDITMAASDKSTTLWARWGG
jgi:hypothetical protein